MGFRLINVDGCAALQEGEGYYDLARVSPSIGGDPVAAIACFEELHGVGARLRHETPDGRTSDVTLGAPVPNPSKVFGIGLNYRSHAEESKAEVPTVPMVFTKFPNCIAGPTSEIELRSDRVDWEVELVVVIGRRGRDIPGADAWSYVAGLTVGQDISDRAVQFATQPPQFSMGKSFDTYGPIGPAIVSLDLLPNRDDLVITCDVAGEPKQEGRTSDMIFSIPDIVVYLSSIATLLPGDLIFTGTPAGIGAPAGRFLAHGEEIQSTIQGIGSLKNRCRRVGDH